ncbi:MAG: hypothetical protein MUW51_05540 [Lactococcus lactis]|nr:hypothetical protein [Lactococcus lactis]
MTKTLNEIYHETYMEKGATSTFLKPTTNLTTKDFTANSGANSYLRH